LADGRTGAVEQLGYFLRGEVVDVAEGDDASLQGWELVEEWRERAVRVPAEGVRRGGHSFFEVGVAVWR
jgi:hypothetical protein